MNTDGNIITFDVETTTKNKGSPYDPSNKLISLVTYDGKTFQDYYLDFNLDLSNTTLIGFNIKFDLAWARRTGIKFNNSSVWDCQVAEFILEGQTNPYPSLNDTAIKYGFETKLDVVKTEYWEKGIDTDEIPKYVLLQYNRHDVLLTYKIYLRQKAIFESKPHLYRLFVLLCEDLLTLEEMQWNGILFDKEAASLEETQALAELGEIEEQLKQHTLYPINWDSGDQLSCFLYGGTFIEKTRVPNGTFKSGARVGHTKYKLLTQDITLPRIFEPIKGSELKKEGFYSSDEKILRALKCPTKTHKEIIHLILERSRLQKLITTYYQGLFKLIERKNWTHDNILHGNFNQCVARTGRLSSSDPNQQNMSGDIKKLFISRFEN